MLNSSYWFSSLLFYRLSLCRHYSSSKVRRGIGRYVGSRLQRLNSKYEGFLKRRFPRFFELYHTFVEGNPAVNSPLRSSMLYLYSADTLCKRLGLCLLFKNCTLIRLLAVQLQVAGFFVFFLTGNQSSNLLQCFKWNLNGFQAVETWAQFQMIYMVVQNFF